MTLRRSDFGYEDAGFWVRLLALIIDGIILIPADLGFITFVLPMFEGLERTPILSFFSSYGILLIYGTLLEASPMQATIGKKVLSLVVLDSDQQPMGYLRAFLRNLVKCILLGIPVIGHISFIVAGLNDRKQGIHDLITGCLVERKVSL